MRNGSLPPLKARSLPRDLVVVRLIRPAPRAEPRGDAGLERRCIVEDHTRAMFAEELDRLLNRPDVSPRDRCLWLLLFEGAARGAGLSSGPRAHPPNRLTWAPPLATSC